MIEKMKNFLLIVSAILLFAATHTRAAEAVSKTSDANIYGHVIDKRTGAHLPYVAVVVKGTTLGTTTDASGHYFLKNLPTGELTVEVSYIGYRTACKQVTSKKETTQELNFELDEDNVAMDEVVVTANRQQTLRRTAPSLVHVLPTKLFENTHATCLAQGLTFQPGVRVEDNCQNCGFTQVRINGLDGHYSQILIDSRPVFSALAGVYGLEQIPANMIERVEVVRGGGSALFGASAIGGTINIITKEPVRNSSEVGHSLLAIGSAYENNSTLNASLVSENGRAGVYLYGQNRYRQGYDHDGDGYTELPNLHNQTVGLRSFLKISPYSKLTLQYHGINEFRRGGNRLDLPPHEANIAEQLEHNINGGGVSYDYFSPDEKNRASAYFSFQNTDRKSYYGGTGDGSDESREEALLAYGTTHDLTLVSGAQYVRRFERLLFLPSDLTFGAEYSYDGLNDDSAARDWHFDQTVHIISAYVQNEWKNEQWSILAGVRMDKHNLVDHAIFSPRVNVRFNPRPGIGLRVTYGRGFRAPQTFDEDLHIDIVGGNRIVTRLAKDLREEQSDSFSLSADLYGTWDNVRGNLLVEGFCSLLDNVFAERRFNPDSEGTVIKERYNARSAQVYGLNVEGKLAFSSWLELQAGVTLQKSRYDEAVPWDEDAPGEKKMLRTPDSYGYFTATTNPFKHFSASLSGTYTGPMLVGHAAGSGVETPVAVTTPAFFTLNLRMAYDLVLYREVGMQIYGGVQNLTDAYQKDFDRGWNRDSGYIYGPSLPRSWFIGIKISL